MTATAPLIHTLRTALAETLVGQRALIDRLLIGLLTGGHVLVEGLPGLAKTTAVKTLAMLLGLPFRRIQFTPDLLPADLTGSEVFDPRKQHFEFLPGPLFHDVVLADEINRAPAKVQSALLEAMQERQITIGGVSHPLPAMFFVMATQNPLEQAGTYPLPQAQLDRFLLQLRLDYPSEAEEREILRRHPLPAVQPLPGLNAQTLLDARAAVRGIHRSSVIDEYLVRLVRATRTPPDHLPQWAGLIACGASPRAVLALATAAQAHALLNGRDHVRPEDVQALAGDVLRHRISLGLQAELQGLRVDAFIDALLAAVPAP